jgi:hypothetical protein
VLARCGSSLHMELNSNIYTSKTSVLCLTLGLHAARYRLIYSFFYQGSDASIPIIRIKILIIHQKAICEGVAELYRFCNHLLGNHGFLCTRSWYKEIFLRPFTIFFLEKWNEDVLVCCVYFNGILLVTLYI